jgi:hypothetical protein
MLMTIWFTCPTCSQQLQVPADRAGTRTSCPTCGQQLAIPAAQAGGAYAPGSPAPVPVVAPVVPVYVDNVPIRKPSSGTGVASMVCGIVGLVMMMPILGPVALILAKQALKEDPRDDMAKAGLVLGWIGTGICGLGCLILMAYMAFIFFIIVLAGAGAARGM